MSTGHDFMSVQNKSKHVFNNFPDSSMIIEAVLKKVGDYHFLFNLSRLTTALLGLLLFVINLFDHYLIKKRCPLRHVKGRQ